MTEIEQIIQQLNSTLRGSGQFGYMPSAIVGGTPSGIGAQGAFVPTGNASNNTPPPGMQVVGAWSPAQGQYNPGTDYNLYGPTVPAGTMPNSLEVAQAVGGSGLVSPKTAVDPTPGYSSFTQNLYGPALPAGYTPGSGMSSASSRPAGSRAASNSDGLFGSFLEGRPRRQAANNGGPNVEGGAMFDQTPRRTTFTLPSERRSAKKIKGTL